MLMSRGINFLKTILKRWDRPKLSVAVRLSGPRPTANQRVLLRGKGMVLFGDNIIFGWEMSPLFESSYAYVEARRPQSKISIGSGCIFSNDVAIISEHEAEMPSIAIGERCVIGSRFRCYDSDFHGLRAVDRNNLSAIRTRPVKIGDDCFFGESCMVLKGVTLGNRCVVGAGSVVTQSFPDDSLIAGNPARLVRRIEQNA